MNKSDTQNIPLPKDEGVRQLNKWISIALVNLCIVALLGFTMRSKMLFPLPFIDFKNTLESHSHFAFGGWITLALMALMIYELLPPEAYKKPIYRWVLIGTLINAVGMLISFLYQGYAFFSILFATLFILVTYVFTYQFIRDIRKTTLSRLVKICSVSSVAYLSLSSVGPFGLGYLLAVKSSNMYLYKDAIYTYLHLQYSGFFPLAIFALFFHKLNGSDNRTTMRFARVLVFSVVPSLFIDYLWHYPNIIVQIIALIGSVSLLAGIYQFFLVMKQLKPLADMQVFAKKILVIALVSFVLKLLLQSLTIIPELGANVFNNRPIIIGFLHLVLLGSVSLFLIAHFTQYGLLNNDRRARRAVTVFTFGFIVNEVVLMSQGLGAMFMLSSAAVQWLLWGAAICLFVGAFLIMMSKFRKSPNLTGL